MAAIGFERIAPRTLLVRGPTNLGLYECGDGSVVLIDSGNDEDAGRKVLRACESAGYRIRMIVNTHSNADHCGGNAFIQARTGCRIAATRIEAAFIETPVLEPSYLWGGFPPPALRSKFLMAQPSRVTDILEAPGEVLLGGVGGAEGSGIIDSAGVAAGTGSAGAPPNLRVLPLPGHFFGMAGILTDDGVFFAADSVASIEILQKYHVFYLYDLAAHLATLDMLDSLKAEWFVPSHAAPVRDISPVVAANRAKVFEIADFLRLECERPASFETLLAALADHYSIELNNSQYALIGSTLRSFLSWMVATKEIGSAIEGNRMLFTRARIPLAPDVGRTIQ